MAGRQGRQVGVTFDQAAALGLVQVDLGDEAGVGPRLQRPVFAAQRGVEAEEAAGAYHARPRYQQNDYLGWIAGAKRPETQARRLATLIEEGIPSAAIFAAAFGAHGVPRSLGKLSQAV